MGDQLQLAKELAAAAEPCFDTADRLAVYTEMNLGAEQHAIDDIICAVFSRGSPDTGRTARPAAGMAGREPHR